MSAWDTVTCAACLEDADWGVMARRWVHRSGRTDHKVVLPDYYDSTVCPQCGKPKKAGFSTCRACEDHARGLARKFQAPRYSKAPSEAQQARRDAERVAEARSLTDEERAALGLGHPTSCGPCPACEHRQLIDLGLRHGPRNLTEWELDETA